MGQDSQSTSSSSSWWDTAAHAVEGAAAATLAMPWLGPVAPILGGVMGVEAGNLFGGLFGDDAKPAEAKKGVAKAAEAAKPKAEPAEAQPTRVAPGEKAAPTSAEQSAAEAKIDASYGKGAAPAQKNQSLADLDKMSKDDRLKLLNSLTQQTPGAKGADEHMCGPAAIIAAAMTGGGTEGLKTLMNKIQQDGGKDSANAKDMQALMDKMQKGELGTKDLDVLKKDLYGDLQGRQLQADKDRAKKEGIIDPATITGTNPGTGTDTMSAFLKDSGMNKYFFDDKGNKVMNIDLIANEKGAETAGHYVLEMNNTEAGNKTGAALPGQDGYKYNAVYDPYAKQSGKQVTTAASDPALMKAYLNTLSGVPLAV